MLVRAPEKITVFSHDPSKIKKDLTGTKMSGKIWGPKLPFSNAFNVHNKPAARSTSKLLQVILEITIKTFLSQSDPGVFAVCNYLSLKEQLKPTQTPLEQCRNSSAPHPQELSLFLPYKPVRTNPGIGHLVSLFSHSNIIFLHAYLFYF